MKSEAEIREMIQVVKDEIEKLKHKPAFNTPTQEAIREVTIRYEKKIQVLEWVLTPSEEVRNEI